MNSTINYEDLKKQMKREEFKRKFKEKTLSIKEKAVDVGKWYMDHKEVTVPVTLAVIGLATKGIGRISSEMRQQRIEKHRNLMSWDPRLGEYLELKRALTNSEKVILDSRIASGERKVDVLYDLGVLK